MTTPSKSWKSRTRPRLRRVRRRKKFKLIRKVEGQSNSLKTTMPLKSSKSKTSSKTTTPSKSLKMKASSMTTKLIWKVEGRSKSSKSKISSKTKTSSKTTMPPKSSKMTTSFREDCVLWRTSKYISNFKYISPSLL